MTLSADDVETIKKLIVDPLSKQIDTIHSPDTCTAILAVKEDIKIIHKKVDDLKGQQKYFAGIFTALLFIVSFFKEGIIALFKR